MKRIRIVGQADTQDGKRRFAARAITRPTPFVLEIRGGEPRCSQCAP